jgi:ABC-type amino acid transport substrate-binding protein
LIRKSFIIFLLALSLFSFSSCSGEKVDNLSEKAIVAEVNSNSYLAAKTLSDSVKEIKTISTEDGAVALVESKDADFVVLDEFKSSEYIENKRKLEVVRVLDFTMDYCAYFHNSQDLLNKFNAEIIALLQDGTIKTIKDSYKTGETFYPELQKLKENAPILTVATDVVGFPFTDLTSEGAIVGIDIDILTIVANRLGYNLELIIAPTDEAFSLLQKDEVDMVISGLTYEAERDAVYDASISYLSVEYYLHSRK